MFRRAIIAALVGTSVAILFAAVPSAAQTTDAPDTVNSRQGVLERSESATLIPALSVFAGLAILGSTLGAITVRRRSELMARQVSTASVRMASAEVHGERMLAGSVSTRR